jgi:hypothetical protein
MGDALALRMVLVSNRRIKTTPSLMPLRDCLILLRVRLPCFRIVRVTFYILQNIPNIRLGRTIHARKPYNVSHHAFMYKNEDSSSRHTTHVKMPNKKIHAASNEHNVSFKTFDASYVLTNKSGKVVVKYVGVNTRAPKLVFGYPRCLFLTSKDPRLFGYLRTRPKIVL